MTTPFTLSEMMTTPINGQKMSFSYQSYDWVICCSSLYFEEITLKFCGNIHVIFFPFRNELSN